MFSGIDVGHRSGGDGHDIGIVFGLQFIVGGAASVGAEIVRQISSAGSNCDQSYDER
jgi:hypothetical protein